MSKFEAAISLKKLFEQYAKRLLTNKVRPSISEEGIMTIPNKQRVEKMAVSLYDDFKKAGVPDNILKTENDIKVFHHKIAEINNENIVRQLGTFEDVFSPKKSADVFDLKGNKIKNPNNIMGGEELPGETNIFSNKYLNDLDKKIIDSDAFGYSQKEWNNLSNSSKEKFRRQFDSNYEDAMENTKMATLKAVETDEQIKKRLMDQNKKSLDSMKKKLDEPDDMATGGRAGYYGGGPAMVGEDLSEIGHGSDSLMARNMQLAPNSMATTSTGLNYLLGQDNDTARVPYSEGKNFKEYLKDREMNDKKMYEEQLMREYLEDMRRKKVMDSKQMAAEGGRIGYNKGKAVAKVVDKGRRGFMKAAGAAGAGIAALKTGLLGFADKAAPVVEKVAEAAPQVPAYFLNLVQKIKNLGTDVTEVLAYKDRQKVTKYKDYELTEDLTTGKQEIQRMKVLDDDSASYYGQPLTEETYMSYKPGKGQIDETTKGKTPPDEYEEGTALLRSDREFAGEVVEESATISDDVIEEGTKFEDNLSDFGKADGGRIGFGKGDIVTKGGPALIKAGEGAFTKAQYLIERIKNTIKGSPDDKYVQETFPGFIKELEANPDLAKNENVFKELGGDLPDNQQIVVYGDDTLDFFTTSSGPKNIKKLENFMAKHNLPKDQALRIMKMEPNDQVMELTKTKFLKQKRTDNASGGLATMLGE